MTYIPPQGHREKRVKVDVRDILPHEEKIDPIEQRKIEMQQESEDQVRDAIIRLNKEIIQPQKEIIMNTIIDAQAGESKTNAGELLIALNKFGYDQSEVSANTYKHYDKVRGEEIQAEVIRDLRKQYQENGKVDVKLYDVMKGELPPSIDKTSSIENSYAIEELETPEVVHNISTEDEEDSIAIDPSMLL